MNPKANIDEYIEALRTSKRMRHQVVYHQEIPLKPPDYVTKKNAFSQGIRHVLSALNIDALYTHQYNAISEIRNGRHIVVSTPTASGKTLIYNLPVLERIQADPESRAIYIFPL